MSKAKKTKPKDDVNSPDHYTHGGIETRDYLLAKLGVEGYVSYCYGNILKYASRAPFKGTEIKDLRKMVWYANDVISIREQEQNVNRNKRRKRPATRRGVRR